MPDANLVKSTTYLFDCFVDDYYDEKYCHMMTDLDMRAQVEVNIPIYISLMRRDEIVESVSRVASSSPASGRWAAQ